MTIDCVRALTTKEILKLYKKNKREINKVSDRSLKRHGRMGTFGSMANAQDSNMISMLSTELQWCRLVMAERGEDSIDRLLVNRDCVHAAEFGCGKFKEFECKCIYFEKVEK